MPNNNLMDKFDEAAQAVLGDSLQILANSHNSQLEVEHILLAMLQQRNGILPQVLQQLEVEANPIERALREKIERLPKMAYPTGNGGNYINLYIAPGVQQLFASAETMRQYQGLSRISP